MNYSQAEIYEAACHAFGIDAGCAGFDKAASFVSHCVRCSNEVEETNIPCYIADTARVVLEDHISASCDEMMDECQAADFWTVMSAIEVRSTYRYVGFD